MRRRLLSVSAAVLLLAGCSTVDLTETAARVGDVEIPLEEVRADAQLVAQQNGLSEADVFPDTLTNAIIDVALLQFLDERGVEADPSAVQDAIDFAASSNGLTTEEFLAAEADNGRDEDEVRSRARTQVRLEAFQTALFDSIEVSEVEIAALYEQRRDQLATADASHILVATEEEAADVLRRLEDGEDFAAVAEEVSTDSGSAAFGGSLGEQPISTYVEPFAVAVAEAPLGEVVGPVETQFGFHVIRVDERSPAPSLAEVRDQLREELAGQVYQDVLLATVRDAFAELDIAVNGRFGTWDPQAAQVGAVVRDGLLVEDAG